MNNKILDKIKENTINSGINNIDRNVNLLKLNGVKLDYNIINNEESLKIKLNFIGVSEKFNDNIKELPDLDIDLKNGFSIIKNSKYSDLFYDSNENWAMEQTKQRDKNRLNILNSIYYELIEDIERLEFEYKKVIQKYQEEFENNKNSFNVSLKKYKRSYKLKQVKKMYISTFQLKIYEIKDDLLKIKNKIQLLKQKDGIIFKPNKYMIKILKEKLNNIKYLNDFYINKLKQFKNDIDELLEFRFEEIYVYKYSLNEDAEDISKFEIYNNSSIYVSNWKLSNKVDF